MVLCRCCAAIYDDRHSLGALPLLTKVELGDYSSFVLGQEFTGHNKDLLSGLYIGRRCFFTDAVTENADQCRELWDKLMKGVSSMTEQTGEDTWTDSGFANIGHSPTVHNADDSLALLDNKDVLSATGLYDTQLYCILSEHKSAGEEDKDLTK